jgi:MFS family permease
MAPAPNRSERRLVLLIGAVVFVDTMFYAAIAPLLPTLAHQLALSKLSAGVLTASYPIGMLLGSVPGGLLVVRTGPRFTVCAGLALLAGSTLAFGFLENAAALDAARLIEGLGGACSWAGGLAWIVAEAPLERRGRLIGDAIGAAIGGALFGPVIGTVATAIGRAATFSAVVLLAFWLIAEARRQPSLPAAAPQGMRHLRAALCHRSMVVAMWLVSVPAIASGLISVLGPLRLHQLGAGAAAIGATFVVATAIEALISPVVGRLSDRSGRMLPMQFGLAGAIVVLLCFPLPTNAALLALIVVGTSVSLSAFWAPGMALLSDEAESRGLDQAFAAALMNVAWAGGQILGSGGGGAVAKATGDAVPIAIAAAMFALTLFLTTGAAHSAARQRPARPLAP